MIQWSIRFQNKAGGSRRKKDEKKKMDTWAEAPLCDYLLV